MAIKYKKNTMLPAVNKEPKFPNGRSTYHQKEIGILTTMGLTEPQALFIVNYVMTGHLTNSAKLAGFSPAWGNALLIKPLVCEAIETLFNYRIKTAGPIAFDAVMRVLSDKTAENKDILNAAKLLFEQLKNPRVAGAMQAGNKDTAEGLKELQEQIGDLSRQLGLDAKDITPDTEKK